MVIQCDNVWLFNVTICGSAYRGNVRYIASHCFVAVQVVESEEESLTAFRSGLTCYVALTSRRTRDDAHAACLSLGQAYAQYYSNPDMSENAGLAQINSDATLNALS